MDTVEESRKLTSSQLRKIKKPLIEKRRRERINESLTQLKSLILEALNKDENQYNKMEKADILELTVKHLKTITSQQKRSPSKHPSRPSEEDHDVHIQGSDVHIQNYKAGFVHCVSEVQQYMQKSATVQQNIKNHLANHLNARLQDMPKSEQVQSPPHPAKLNGYVQILPKEAVVLGKEALSSPAVSPQGVQCIQSVPILNGQTLVLANPIQGLHSPTYQPMIQLAQPLVTYIPQQQQQQVTNNMNDMNNNNNINKPANQLTTQPELMVHQGSSRLLPSHRDQTLSVQTNMNVTSHPHTGGCLQISPNTECSPRSNNRTLLVMSGDDNSSAASRTSVSIQNHARTFVDNLNSVKTTVRRDFNQNERLCQGSPVLSRTEQREPDHMVYNGNDHVMLNATTRYNPEQFVSDHKELISSGCSDRFMWRPW